MQVDFISRPLLNLFTLSRSILAEFVNILRIINTITSANWDCLIFFFSYLYVINCLLLPYHSKKKKASRMTLWRNLDKGQPYLLPDLTGISSRFSPLKMTMNMSFSHIAFIMLKHIHSDYEEMFILVKGYFSINWDDHVIFFGFKSVYVLYYIDWLVYI